MKCAATTCTRSVLTREQLRQRAVMWATSIEGERNTPDSRAAFACFGLLLVGELAIRCETCATERVMTGVTAVASVAGDG